MRNRLVFTGLFCLFLGWNLPNHYPPWPSFHLELLSACAVVILFVAVALPLAPVGPVRPPGLQQADVATGLPLPAATWAVLLVAIVPLLQYVTGLLRFRGDAMLGMLYGLGLAVSIYVGHLFAAQQGRQRSLELLFLAILWGAIASNGMALSQWLRLDTPGWWVNVLIESRPFGNFAQPNHFGLLMVLGLVAAVGLFEQGVLRGRPVLYLLVAFFGWGAIVSQSRASALALFGVALCWLLNRKRGPTRLRPAEVLGAVVLWLLLHQALESIQIGLLLQQEAFKQPLQAGVRPIMWHSFGLAVLAHPWAGYGFGQGVQALAQGAIQVAPSGATIATSNAHNFALDLMVWAGVPCALLILTALVLWMSGWLKRNQDGQAAPEGQLVFAVWLALLIQSLFEYPFAYAYFLLPAGLLAGAITRPRAEFEGMPAATRYSSSRTGWVVALLGVTMLSALVVDYWQLEDDFRTIRFVRANYVNQPQHDYLEQPLVLDQLALSNTTARYSITRGMSPDQLENMRAVARRFQNWVLQLDYAKALALNGRMKEARDELQLIRSLYQHESFLAIEQRWDEWLQQSAATLAQPQPR